MPLKRKNKSIFVIVFAAFWLFFLPNLFLYAEILYDWDDDAAYKPNPVLFLHGFANGNPSSWSPIVFGYEKNGKSSQGINQYFDKYTLVKSGIDLSIPYLERIAFRDPNGSVDTYNNGNNGWADTLRNRIKELSVNYRFKNIYVKFNLICHSMGGLAAREFITNPKYAPYNQVIDKMITIGTPHAGTSLANVKKVVKDSVKNTYKYVWKIRHYGTLIDVTNSEKCNWLLNLLMGKNGIDLQGEAIKDMAVNSPFLKILNDNKKREFPGQIKKLAIYGIATSVTYRLMNLIFFHDYYLPEVAYDSGDGIVPMDSQKGYDIMSDYPFRASWVWKPNNFVEIRADHQDELENIDIAKKILEFLDSAKPEFEITDPNPSTITEVAENSIHLKGRVYKEYLPADTELSIDVIKQEDGYKKPTQTSFLKPSDLWIPNDPTTPVAEFDELITFPGTGTYEISCQAKNPAGVMSDIQKAYVKVTQGQYAAIIVHCHNPEGKELGSLDKVEPNDVKIYADDTVVGNGAYSMDVHNKPIIIPAATKKIKAEFNGMVKEQSYTFEPGAAKEITFTFERTELIGDIKDRMNFNFTHAMSLLDTNYSGIIYEEYEFGQSRGFYTKWSCNANTYVTIQGIGQLKENNTYHFEGHLTNGSAECWNKQPNISTGWGVSAVVETISFNLNDIITLPSTSNKWFVQGKGMNWLANCLTISSTINGLNVGCPVGIPSSNTDNRYIYTLPPGSYTLSGAIGSVAGTVSIGKYEKIGSFEDDEGYDYLTDNSPALDWQLADSISNIPYDYKGAGF